MTWLTWAVFSALLSAAAAILQKKVLFRVTALEFSFLVSFVVLLCSCFIPLTADIGAIAPAALGVLLGKSILNSIAFLLVMVALEKNQISSALPLLGLTPGVTAVLSFFVLGEGLRGWEWMGLGCMMAGIYILEKRPQQKSAETLKAFFLSQNHLPIFGALGFFAISSIGDKVLVSGYRTSPFVVLFYQHAITFLIYAIVLFTRRISFSTTFRKGREQAGYLIIIALVTLAYRFAQLDATKLGPVALVLAVKRTSILLASFFGGKLFSDERLRVKLLGAACIVVAGFLILRAVG